MDRLSWSEKDDPAHHLGTGDTVSRTSYGKATMGEYCTMGETLDAATPAWRKNP